MAYPISEETVRPYRLWDAKNKEQMRWRYYSDLRHCHLGALVEVRWSPIGTTIEVFNALTGRLMGQYTRKVHTIEFTGPQHLPATN